MTLNSLKARFRFWNLEEFRVPLYCHGNHVHSGLQTNDWCQVRVTLQYWKPFNCNKKWGQAHWKKCLQVIYWMCMYKLDFVLNNLQWLLYHKTQVKHSKRVQTPVALLRPLSDKYAWERYEPPYPPSYRLNSTTTVLLEWSLWH